MWALKDIIQQFVIGMICCAVIYVIWRIGNPGKKW